MLALRILLLLLLILLPSAASAQLSRQLSLQITIVLDGENQPTNKELTVTLMDEWSAIIEVQSTNKGMLNFFTKPGIHRIRIVGAEIEQLDEEFVIDEHFQRRFTFVVVPRLMPSGPRRPTAKSVAAVRLKIPRKAQDAYKKAEKALKQQRWTEAQQHYQRAVELYPSYDLAHYGLAKLALFAGDKEAGRRHLQTAVGLNDTFAEAARKLAELLMSEKKLAEAEPLLRKSLESEPTNVWALTALATTALAAGKTADAITHAQLVHTLPHAGYASSHLIAARALEASQRPQDALANYKQYLAEDPNGPHAALAQAAVARLSATPTPPQ